MLIMLRITIKTEVRAPPDFDLEYCLKPREDFRYANLVCRISEPEADEC